MDKTWTDADLKKSAFFKSIKILKDMKYYEIGSRFVQHHDLETKRLLTETEYKSRPIYDMFDLFVDPIVDTIHPRTKALFGIDPIDEPLLASVFRNNHVTMSDYLGEKIMLPNPEMLISMKINSVLTRNKNDKRIKDIADIYSLTWHSNKKFQYLKHKIQKMCTNIAVISDFTDHDYDEVSRILSIERDEISRVITELAKK